MKIEAEKGSFDVGKVVLVMEDDHLVRDFIGTSLDRRGYLVIEAACSVEARRSLEVVTPQVLLTDLTLGACSGAALVAELRKRLDCLPTIFMSGFREEHVRGAMAA